jgi:hypothetical protein
MRSEPSRSSGGSLSRNTNGSVRSIAREGDDDVHEWWRASSYCEVYPTLSRCGSDSLLGPIARNSQRPDKLTTPPFSNPLTETPRAPSKSARALIKGITKGCDRWWRHCSQNRTAVAAGQRHATRVAKKAGSDHCSSANKFAGQQGGKAQRAPATRYRATSDSDRTTHRRNTSEALPIILRL